jgi:hypothetical protein
VTGGDLETVFSRRTTRLYFDGKRESPVDPESIGHLGAEIGVVKRITKDREGLGWLRFHTARGLEKHDGLQFEATVDGRHVGMGIVEMRQAISRRPVFEVNAGVDVEVRVAEDVAAALKPGMKIYCSMSNAVKRMFPTPSFRPSDYEGGTPIDVEVRLEQSGIAVFAQAVGRTFPPCEARIDGALQPAKNPEKTAEGVKKAFSKLGDTDYRLGELTVNDPEKLFAPMSLLNDLRRDLVEKLDEAREKARREKAGAAIADDAVGSPLPRPARRVKIRAGQKVPASEWDEVIVGVGIGQAELDQLDCDKALVRLALPVYTAEPEFNRLRVAVKGFLRKGFDRWEASDLATLRMLKELGVTDITADWTLYAFNSRALAELSEMGVKRFVASPENTRENLQYLAESGYDVEFLTQQSTPLFVSLAEPAAKPAELAVFCRDGLFVTTKKVPRTFETPEGVSTRLDLSWDPE